MNIILLIISVFLGAGRSIFSKKMTSSSINSKSFYINQSVLFLSAAIAICLFNINALSKITLITLIFGLCFGVATFLAQWCYSIALNKGPTSICAMVYSFGFIFPTLSGALFWKEPFGITSFIGILLAVSAIIASAFSGSKDIKFGCSFIIPNLIAMLSSGALGILQKVHQNSLDKENLEGFLTIAFLLASVIAFVFSLFQNSNNGVKTKINIFSVLAGVCFGLVSMLNTLLAGRMPSAVIFPTLNIGVMILCLVAGILFFKEKPTKSQFFALGLGIFSIAILSLI